MKVMLPNSCLTPSFVFKQEMSAFTIFLDHWMREENLSKRTSFYHQMGIKINGSIISKMQVRQFGEILAEFYQLGGQNHELFLLLRYMGERLVMINAPLGCCDACHQSVYFHERQNNDLILVCQNERCRDVCFYFLELFE